MGEYGHRLYQDDLWVDEVMTIHREAGVYTSPYPCPQFMQAAGIWEDYQVLLSNAGLDNFIAEHMAQAFFEILDGRNESIGKGVTQVLGRDPIKFTDFVKSNKF